mgnify:FL=1
MDRVNEKTFGKESVLKILLKLAPPVMFAQLIQALYNVVDSFYVGKYSDDGLTALSVIYPVQLLIVAIAVGVGVNTLMASYFAKDEKSSADKTAGTGMVLALICWAIFSLSSLAFLKPFVKISAKSKLAQKEALTYGTIVCVGSLGIFLESCFTKVHQASGNMWIPTVAQVAGAVTNIILDPVLIFGWEFFPKMGIAGAGIATVIGQFIACIITGIKGAKKPPKPKEGGLYVRKIWHYGYPNMLMQALFTVYIIALNLILASFTDSAITVLGLYYKLQSFFFIPLFALQTCIVPILSFNYVQQKFDRVRQIVKDTLIISCAFMSIGIFCFEIIPVPLIKIFSKNQEVLNIGKIGFRIIGSSFLPAVFSLTAPVVFQAIGKSVKSSLLSLTRQIFCLIPTFYLFSLIGLNYCWIAFPLSETITTILGVVLYIKEVKTWKKFTEN